jgi:hypothetical protein
VRPSRSRLGRRDRPEWLPRLREDDLHRVSRHPRHLGRLALSARPLGRLAD